MHLPGLQPIWQPAELHAPVSRAWRALTDYTEFGIWFRVAPEGPFVAGQSTRGRLLYPGYEHLVMEVEVQKVEPQCLFSFHRLDPKPIRDARESLEIISRQWDDALARLKAFVESDEALHHVEGAVAPRFRAFLRRCYRRRWFVRIVASRSRPMTD